MDTRSAKRQLLIDARVARAEQVLQANIAHWRARGLRPGLVRRVLPVARILRSVLPVDIADPLALQHLQHLRRRLQRLWHMLSPYRVVRTLYDEAAMMTQVITGEPVTWDFFRELRIGGPLQLGGTNMVLLMTRGTQVIEYPDGTVGYRDHGRRAFTVAEGGLMESEGDVDNYEFRMFAMDMLPTLDAIIES